MPSPAVVDERVGGAQVDGEVAGHGSVPLAYVAVRAPVAGRQGVHLAAEALDARVDGAGRAGAGPEHGDARPTATTTAARRKSEVRSRSQVSGQRSGVRSESVWASSPQLSPPAQVSRFQMGAVSFKVSMQQRAASKASFRCGRTGGHDDRRLADGHGRPCGAGGPAARGRASGRGRRRRWPGTGVRSGSRRPRTRGAATSGRPSAWSRAVPVKVTTAPHDGRTAQSATTADRQRLLGQPHPGEVVGRSRARCHQPTGAHVARGHGRQGRPTLRRPCLRTRRRRRRPRFGAAAASRGPPVAPPVRAPARAVGGARRRRRRGPARRRLGLAAGAGRLGGPAGAVGSRRVTGATARHVDRGRASGWPRRRLDRCFVGAPAGAASAEVAAALVARPHRRGTDGVRRLGVVLRDDGHVLTTRPRSSARRRGAGAGRRRARARRRPSWAWTR